MIPLQSPVSIELARILLFSSRHTTDSPRLGSAAATLGSGFEMDAIAAVVIGGTSMSGGVGTVGGTFIGVLIIGVITNGLNLMGINSFWQEVFKGIIILVAVVIDVVRKTKTKE